MPTIDFPSSPINGQTYTFGAKTWQWNSTTGAWRLLGGASVASSAISVTPTGNITSTDVQSALAELDSKKYAIGAPFVLPGGRLTLATGTPVMINTTGATSHFYTQYLHQLIPIYNGSSWVITNTGGELTQTFADTTKSPAAVIASSNYDVFVWNDSGTIRATRGPAWSSNTARGTGAGTTELVQQDGIWVNKNAIVNGPPAKQGTYVGSFRSNSSIQGQFNLVGSASGTAAFLGCWNMYNRVNVTARQNDPTSSWPYAIATVRAKNGNSGNAILFLSGIAEDSWMVTNSMTIQGTATSGQRAIIGINFDASNALTAKASSVNGSASSCSASCSMEVNPQLGWHTIYAVESAEAAATVTFYTDGMQLVGSWRC